MTRFAFTLAGFALAAVLLANVAGCNSSSPSPSGPDADTKQKGDQAGVSPAEQKKIDAALAELSPEDRALAEKQKTCPVTGERLGSMGKPEKITVQGKALFICCDHCKEEVEKNPEKYLAAVGQ